jgi:signal transduction histidine kinase
MGSKTLKNKPGLLWLIKGMWIHLISVPIALKIMGTGLIVALIFGSIVLYQVRSSLSNTLYHVLERRTLSSAISLTPELERFLVLGDLFSLQRRLLRTMKTDPSLSYIIVEDRNNNIILHTFQKSVPPDLVGLRPLTAKKKNPVRVFESEKGLILEVAVPLLNGNAGQLRLAKNDQAVTRQLITLSKLLFLTLGLCMTIGMGLAMLLTYLLTRPIKNLLLATQRISQGDFNFRARIYSNDEIGRLSRAFNLMAENLKKYQNEVKEKEAGRQALLEKIVHTQEEERGKIARDLHDQLGQTLSVLLMEIQSLKSSSPEQEESYQSLETRTGALIDDVRRLAWGMRPSLLDDYGIEVALSGYITEIAKASSFEIDFQYINPPELGRLPIKTEVTLYRIAQEAVTNIIRHAQAAHASVILMRSKKDSLLLIEDDGKGFDSAKETPNGFAHMGMISMRERTTLIDAELTVESTLGSGTTIRVKINHEKEG